MDLMNLFGGSNNSQNSIAPGVFLNKGIIVAAEDKSGEELFGRHYDLALELSIQVEGLEYPKKVTVFGNLAEDRKSLGSAFPVVEVFDAVGAAEHFSKIELEEIRDTLLKGKIPAAFRKAIMGKQIHFITYRAENNGNPKYLIYKRFNKDVDKLISIFKKDQENGYVRVAPSTKENGTTVTVNTTTEEDTLI